MDDLQNFRRITLSFAMGLMQQLTGMNCIVYYAAVVFQQVGLSARLSYIMSCVASIAMLLGSVSAAAVSCARCKRGCLRRRECADRVP